MPQPAASPSSPTVIRVSASSSVEVPADKASLHVSLSGTSTTKDGALAALSHSRDRLTQVLTRFDRTVEHVQVLSTGVRATATAELFETEPTQFTARTSVRVDVGDVAGISALYSALLALEPDSLQGPYWSLRPGHNAEDIVRRDAVREATGRARSMAEAAGSELLCLDWLEDESAAPHHMLSRSGAVGSSRNDEISLEPAPQTVEAAVRAQYQIAPVTFSRTNQGRNRP